MGEAVGQIKVLVVRGKRLVIRDFKSSDPYVILKLGNQTAKTKVIGSCLNPVWNEEFSLSFSEPIGALGLSCVFFSSWICAVFVSQRVSLCPLVMHNCLLLLLSHSEVLKLSGEGSLSAVVIGAQEVFDKDVFKADDKMGRAQVSLQPLIAAARLKQIIGAVSDGMTLRKMIPDNDNCLAAESDIVWENNEVVQGVLLRLCEVESGEIELKIKLVQLPAAVKEA